MPTAPALPVDRPGITDPWPVRAPIVTIGDRVHTDEHLLLWQVQGSSDLLLDGRHHELGADQALWIPAGVVHALTVQADSVLLPLFFDADAAAAHLGDAHVLEVPEELRPLLLLHLQYQNSIIRTAEDVAPQILTLLADRPSPPMPTSGHAHRVATILRRDPGDHRSVQALAASAHVSYRTVERAFRAETGMTLHQWRIANRMAAAAQLLRDRTGIPAVATRVGYANVSAFGRVFKAHFGMSPREYARRGGAGVQGHTRTPPRAANGAATGAPPSGAADGLYGPSPRYRANHRSAGSR